MKSLEIFEEELKQFDVNNDRIEELNYINEFCLKILSFANNYFNMYYSLSFEMPKGYETANGLTNNEQQTIFMNLSTIQTQSVYDFLFYFFHELRHAIQYSNTSLFSKAVCQNLKYIVQYDGVIYYYQNGTYKQYKIEGESNYLVEFYLASPCEVDANEFAMRLVNKLFPKRTFDTIYNLWFPKYKYFSKDEYELKFSYIVDMIEGERYE